MQRILKLLMTFQTPKNAFVERNFLINSSFKHTRFKLLAIYVDRSPYIQILLQLTDCQMRDEVVAAIESTNRMRLDPGSIAVSVTQPSASGTSLHMLCLLIIVTGNDFVNYRSETFRCR